MELVDARQDTFLFEGLPSAAHDFAREVHRLGYPTLRSQLETERVCVKVLIPCGHSRAIELLRVLSAARDDHASFGAAPASG